MIYGSHNSLGITPDILNEVKLAIAYLRDKDLVKFGTGIHRFTRFSVQF